MKKLTLCSLALISLSAVSAQATTLSCSLHDGKLVLDSDLPSLALFGKPIPVRGADLTAALEACEDAVAPLACEETPQDYLEAEHNSDGSGMSYFTNAYELVDYSIEGSRNGSGTVMDRMDTLKKCLKEIRKNAVAAVAKLSSEAPETAERNAVRIQMNRNPSDKVQIRQ